MLKKALVLAALLGSVALPVQAGSPNNCAKCACPPAKVHYMVHHISRPARAYHRTVRVHGAYYDYRAAARVGDRFEADWVQAPRDGYDYSYDSGDTEGYASAAYGPQDLTGNPDLNRGWTGGVGSGADGGGGGGGGPAILAGGQSDNGPTYNSFNQSFPFGGADTAATQTNANWRAAGIPIRKSK